jgi:alkylated DNA repair dioxygenase AlkB
MEVERVQLDATSWVDVVRNFLPDADRVYQELQDTVEWRPSRVYRYERYVDEPRMGGWLPRDRPNAALIAAREWIVERYGVPFDGGALALYRDASDSVGFHRDRELKWLENTVIGVLTLGATRPWLMKPMGPGPALRDNSDLTGSIDLMPAGGDLLVMGGRCQSDWLHAVPKVAGACAPRISVQWRWTSRRGKPDMNPGYYEARRFSRS